MIEVKSRELNDIYEIITQAQSKGWYVEKSDLRHASNKGTSYWFINEHYRVLLDNYSTHFAIFDDRRRKIISNHDEFADEQWYKELLEIFYNK